MPDRFSSFNGYVGLSTLLALYKRNRTTMPITGSEKGTLSSQNRPALYYAIRIREFVILKTQFRRYRNIL